MTKTLYDPTFEHDACGVGMVADLSATPSNATIRDALTILENLEHRGASGSDADSGDGAGILIQMPDDFIRAEFGDAVPPTGHYGVAHWMVPKSADLVAIRVVIDEVLERVGLTSLGWRAVPVDSSVLGATSRASEPLFVQQLIGLRPTDPAPDLERALYCARKVLEHTIDIYASSCSPHVLIYKGMLTSPQLRHYFDDLRDERLTSAIAVVHSRFSTNVLPRWDLAQPFRYIAHNGEINTVRGNRNWMTARETSLHSDLLPLPIAELTPLITTGMSDSASFDEAAGQGSGVVVYIHLRRQSEFRMALGGATSGMKMRSYKCTLICLMNSKKTNAEECDADNDTFLDSLTGAIQANRNAGNPAAVFQWGEGDTLYGVDVMIDSHFPRPIRQQTMRQFSLVEVTVLEQMNT